MEHALSPAYLAALEAHNVALSVYAAAVAEFRAGRMTPDDFCAARRVREAADAAFDAAFAAEAAR